MEQILFSAFFTLIMAFSAQAKVPSIKAPVQAVYGKDDRQFVTAQSSAEIKKLSSSVALIVSKDAVEFKFLTALIKGVLLTEKTYVNLCRQEKFAGHYSMNSCTGFLIAPDLLATAGHCFLSEDDCKNKIIAFDVLEKKETSEGYKILKQDLFYCSEIVKHAFNADELSDFAVIRLNKKVRGRTPLRLNRGGSIKREESVFMIGHPLGLPLIATNEARVTETDSEHFFKATLDSFEGNSGAPVFNSKTLEVEGILVRGEEDFEVGPDNQCQRYKTYNEFSEKSESVTKIKDLL